MTFGTVAWAREARGEVRGLERLDQLWKSVVFQIRAGMRGRARPGTRDRLGLSDADVEKLLRETALPTTSLVGRCLDLVQHLGPPALATHVVRTHVWGTVLGLRDGLSWDREVFAVAALLHDLALARRRHGFECFAHDGAEQALEMPELQVLEPARRAAIADAICLHLRVEVAPSLGVEAHLVHAGAGLDVVGRRLGEIEPELRAAVLAAHPRHDFVAVLEHRFREERRRHPRARISRWVQSGFLGFVRRNPLATEEPREP